MQDVYIYNNVFYNGTLMGVGAIGSTTISAIKNNIFYNAASGTLKPIYFVDTTSTFYPYNGASISNASNNLLYRNQGEGSNTLSQGIYPNDIVNLNPNFVSVGTDFRLQARSPAIDTGATISGFSTDILGVSRPQGAAWDIGAYELIVIPPVPPAPVRPQYRRPQYRRPQYRRPQVRRVILG